MILPPTVTSVLRGSVCPSGGSAGKTAKLPALSEFTAPQEQCAGPAQLTESAPKTPTPGGRCGLVPMMSYFASTGIG